MQRERRDTKTFMWRWEMPLELRDDGCKITPANCGGTSKLNHRRQRDLKPMQSASQYDHAPEELIYEVVLENCARGQH